MSPSDGVRHGVIVVIFGEVHWCVAYAEYLPHGLCPILPMGLCCPESASSGNLPQRPMPAGSLHGGLREERYANRLEVIIGTYAPKSYIDAPDRCGLEPEAAAVNPVAHQVVVPVKLDLVQAQPLVRDRRNYGGSGPGG